MKIAQVAPLIESVPPSLYGGTERIVSWLTEELVRQGHEVTLYASGDSETGAQLVPITPRAIRLTPGVVDPLPYLVLLAERGARDAHRFDVIHFHIDSIHYPLLRRTATPGVTTMHGRMDIPDLVPLFEEFREAAVVSISESQRRPLPWLNWVANVPHGLPMGSIRPNYHRGAYLAFLGRITAEKGIEDAIEIAARVGMPLRIAAKIDEVDAAYHEESIKPLLTDGGDVEFIGEIDDEQKDEFLGNAAATLFPIDWPEPFGLVMIESAARGTPVLAFRSGSVPEVIEEGVTGLIVNDVDEAVAAMPRLLDLSREQVRQGVEGRFGAERMARDYVDLYERLIHQRGAAGQRDMADSAITQGTPIDATQRYEPEEVANPGSI
jgi:glycosyltransferase involved in cell wall biosynthesis